MKWDITGDGIMLEGYTTREMVEWLESNPDVTVRVTSGGVTLETKSLETKSLETKSLETKSLETKSLETKTRVRS